MINKKNALLVIAGVLILLQAIRIDKNDPEVDQSADFLTVMQPPLEVANIIRESCYDCHSYETVYPWYTTIAPVSWWIGNHVNEAREHLNFSIWKSYDQKKALHKLEELYEEVEEGEMPLDSYVWMHSEAELSTQQIETLVNWIKSIPGVEEEDD